MGKELTKKAEEQYMDREYQQGDRNYKKKPNRNSGAKKYNS